MFRKKTIALLVCSLLPVVSSAAELVVTPNSPDIQYGDKVDSLNFDSIKFETNGQDFEKFLGKDKNIDILNVTNGLLLNNSSGGGKTIFNVSAKEISFGGIDLGDIFQPFQTIGSIFNIEANTFKTEVAKGQAISVTAGTSLNIGSSQNFVKKVVLGTKDDASAIYADSEGKVDIFGNEIIIESGSKHPSGTPIYVTGTAQVEINAKDRLDITDTNSGDVVRVYGDGVISLKSEGTLNINGNEGKKALWLQQTSGTIGTIKAKGDDIRLTGYVEASVNNKSSTNGIFLEADNSINVTANVDASFSWAAAVHATDNGYIRFTSNDLEINNQSTGERSVGIFLEKKNSEFFGEFSNTATINAMTGIYAYVDNSKFTLNGNAQTQSLLTINSALAGIVAQTRNNSVNDTSVAININYDKNVANPWAPPSGANGITGLGSYGNNGNLLLSNTDSKDKSLTIKVNTKSEYNQDADIITSAISTQGDGKLTIKNFENVNLSVVNAANKATRHGLYAKSGYIKIDEGIGNVYITTTNGNAIFTKKYVNSRDPKDYDPGVIDLSAKNITLTDLGETGVGLNSEKGTINVVASDSFSIDAKDAIKAQSKESVINVEAKTTVQSLVKGDWFVNSGKANVELGTSALVEGKLKAISNGTIDLSLGKLGTLQGSTSTGLFGTGKVNLTLDNGSIWKVTEDSTASVLTLTDSTIDFSRWDAESNATRANTAYRKVSSQTLAGDKNTLRMRIDLGGETENQVLTDQFQIEKKAQGSHTADIQIVGSTIAADKKHSNNWLVHQGEGSEMTITNANGSNTFSGRGMVSLWSLGFVAKNDKAKLDTEEGRAEIAATTTGKGEGNWYLVKHETKPEPNPDPETPNPGPTPDPKPELPPEVQDNITVANSASMALAYDADLEDLRTRIGEVRYGAQDGLWAKAFAKQNRLGGSGLPGFKQEIYGLNLGLDHLVKADEESAWLFGGAFRYSDADQKGLGVGYTTGTLQEYSGKLYATWMHDKGSYADFVLQAGRYEQELDGFDNTGMDKAKADYGTWGFGASVEVGHMFSFGENVDDRQWFNHWFVEPQLQLSYFRAKGADYTTSTGLKVDQGDADYLTGRAGVVLGKKFSYGSINDLDKRYFQIAMIGGVKHEFIGGDQSIKYTGVEGDSVKVNARDIDGSRFYYGVNADWQLSRDWRMYAQFEREKGNDFSEDYDVSVGFKYAF